MSKLKCNENNISYHIMAIVKQAVVKSQYENNENESVSLAIEEKHRK